MMSNLKNSKANQTINSMYTSKCDDTGYDSSYEGIEMIIDGKMDEDLVKKSSDKNTINNYNEFIKKKDDNNLSNNKVMDYYKKNYSGGSNGNSNSNSNSNNNRNLQVIEEDNKEADDLSRIPSGNVNQITNSKIKKNNIDKYIQSMGEY